MRPVHRSVRLGAYGSDRRRAARARVSADRTGGVHRFGAGRHRCPDPAADQTDRQRPAERRRRQRHPSVQRRPARPAGARALELVGRRDEADRRTVPTDPGPDVPRCRRVVARQRSVREHQTGARAFHRRRDPRWRPVGDGLRLLEPPVDRHRPGWRRDGVRGVDGARPQRQSDPGPREETDHDGGCADGPEDAVVGASDASGSSADAGQEAPAAVVRIRSAVGGSRSVRVGCGCAVGGSRSVRVGSGCAVGAVRVGVVQIGAGAGGEGTPRVGRVGRRGRGSPGDAFQPRTFGIGVGVLGRVHRAGRPGPGPVTSPSLRPEHACGCAHGQRAPSRSARRRGCPRGPPSRCGTGTAPRRPAPARPGRSPPTPRRATAGACRSAVRAECVAASRSWR
ncbi:hypothetical protein CURTO8I2_100024 [Curtobacterium sp. 8I-2]|nr:hypothetical protein CURTO8I2_100024 [Curtobacterium sp. 8I-2]